jgi:hypothetical protein
MPGLLSKKPPLFSGGGDLHELAGTLGISFIIMPGK